MVSLGALGRVSGLSWTLLGRSWLLLGRSWPLLGRSWTLLGRSWGALGRSWDALGRSWDALGALLDPAGRSWLDFGASKGGFWSLWHLILEPRGIAFELSSARMRRTNPSKTRGVRNHSSAPLGSHLDSSSFQVAVARRPSRTPSATWSSKAPPGLHLALRTGFHAQAEPSQANLSHAKPSQAKPSPAKPSKSQDRPC